MGIDFDKISRFEQLAQNKINDITTRSLEADNPELRDSLELTKLSLEILGMLASEAFSREMDEMHRTITTATTPPSVSKKIANHTHPKGHYHPLVTHEWPNDGELADGPNRDTVKEFFDAMTEMEKADD